MSAAKFLTYFNAKTQNFIPIGGKASITPEDIAHILGKIKLGTEESEVFGHYVRFRHLGVTQNIEDIARYMRRHLYKIKDSEGWRVPKKDFLLDMCLLSLSEAAYDHICPDCLGRKGGIIEGKYISCRPCGGTGKRRIYDKDRAELLGILESSYSDTWGKRYRKIQLLLDRWDGILESGFNRYFLS